MMLHIIQHGKLKTQINPWQPLPMMTPSNGNIVCITGPLWGKSTSHRWIALTKASDMELWYFLWSVVEQMVKQIIGTPVIWGTIALIMTSM